MEAAHYYAESKTLVKAAMARKWKRDHTDSDPSDPIHGMTRSQQTIIFRLRTVHNRLRQHMYRRFKVGDSKICPCGHAPQNTEHVLETCSSHRQLRARTWPNHTPLEKKLYDTTERTCPDSRLQCGIGSHCLTDSCRKNEEEEEENTRLQYTLAGLKKNNIYIRLFISA